MVRQCKSKYAHLTNLIIQLQDIENIKPPITLYDAAICFGVFPHLQHHERVLQKIYRVLKAKGNLIIAHAWSRSELMQRHHDASSAVAYDTLPAECDMQRLLERTGFTLARPLEIASMIESTLGAASMRV